MSGPTVLVLASGRGERFVASGGQGSKLNAMLDGITVLDRTLAAVRASGLRWHLEDAGHAGMGDSIAAAVRATADAEGWLVLPGDLPLIEAATLQSVAALLAAGKVVLPRHGGQQGHPVGFPAACVQSLMSLAGPKGAAAIVQGWDAQGRVQRVDVDDAGVTMDIDTVGDLARAVAMLRQRGESGR